MTNDTQNAPTAGEMWDSCSPALRAGLAQSTAAHAYCTGVADERARTRDELARLRAALAALTTRT